jgi:sugar lactone lactonase YvrE
MNIDVIRELESYGDYADTMAPAVTLDDLIVRRDGTASTVSAQRRAIPNWTVAIGTAIAIIVLIGGASWLLGGSESEVADEPMPPPTTLPAIIPDMAPVVTVDADQIGSPLPSDSTSGVAVGDGTLWVSTEQDIIQWNLEERDAESLASADNGSFTIEAVGGVAVAPDGTIWAFTWNQGLVQYDGTRWREPTGYGELDVVNPRCVLGEDCENPTTAMAIGPDGLVSVAIGSETLLQYDGNDWNSLPVTATEEHGGSAWATDMAVASDDTLWVASWEELLAYNGNAWARFTEADGLPSGAINSVVVAPNGDIWVGTSDDHDGTSAGGVARFDGDTWTVFDSTNGLYEDAVTTMAVGHDGIVWAVHGSVDSTGSVDSLAVGGFSRFDGKTWSSTTITAVGEGLGWGGAVVDDTGTLWSTSRWGVVGFDGDEATILRVPEGIRPPINAAPFTASSQILAASESPLEWRWRPVAGETIEGSGAQRPVEGSSCFGVGDGQATSTVVEFEHRSIDFALGYLVTPNVAITNEEGDVTEVGNPFGERAWLCSVAATDTRILAVGSGVSWSDDGVTWHGIEAFEEFAGWNVDGANLFWAAAGQGGYMVLGRHGDTRRIAWHSEDLETWYEIPIKDEVDGLIWWGWGGPSGVAVEDEPIIVFYDGAWVGTTREG